MTYKFRLSLLTAVLAVSTMLTMSFFARPAAAAGVDTTRDCDETAIIHCGVMTLSELKTKYAANEPGDLPAIYKAFNITNFDGFVDGVVYRDGTVVVNGKTVATGAMTAARNMPGGDIPGSSANIISPSVWPAQYITGKPAYVKMVNGTFAYAILKTCGNPIKAKPVTPPPAPVAACVSVQKIQKTRDSYEFVATASADHGATISNYSFRITHSSGTAKIINVATNAKTASSGVVQLEPGTHTVKVVVTTSLGEKTSAGCTTTVSIAEEGKVVVCNPETGLNITVNVSEQNKYKPVGDIACKTKVCDVTTKQIIWVDKSEASKYADVNDEACKPKVEGVSTVVTPPATIASTGPTDILAGGAGIGSLTAAGYYWRASRRRLLNSLLNR